MSAHSVRRSGFDRIVAGLGGDDADLLAARIALAEDFLNENAPPTFSENRTLSIMKAYARAKREAETP